MNAPYFYCEGNFQVNGVIGDIGLLGHDGRTSNQNPKIRKRVVLNICADLEEEIAIPALCMHRKDTFDVASVALDTRYAKNDSFLASGTV